MLAAIRARPSGAVLPDPASLTRLLCRIAPTILAMLGLDPMALDAVRSKGLRPLPPAAE
jgi:hypothetical protein